MNWIKKSTGLTAFIITILFLFLGFFALWFTKTVLQMGQDAVLVSIVLIPVLLYLILSGRLQEFSAGGMSVKFGDVAHKLLDEENTELINPVEVEVAMKGKMDQLDRRIKNMNKYQYVVLGVMLGISDYTPEGLLAYLREYSGYPNFKFLVILRRDRSVFAYIAGWRAIQLIEQGLQMQRSGFLGAINRGDEQELLTYGVIGKTLKTADTNIIALKEMTELKMNILIVTDSERKLKGIVEQEQILSKLMLAITK